MVRKKKKKQASRVVRIIAIRHDRHENNFLLPESIERCLRIGKKLNNVLKKRSIPLPVTAVSSRQLRAVATLYFVLKGMELPLAANTHEEFGDMYSGKYPYSKKEAKIIYALGRKLNSTDPEREMVNIFSEKSTLRGREGALKMQRIMKALPEPIILASHGGSRLEPMFQILKKQPIKSPNFFLDRSGVAIFTFSISKSLVTFVSEEYLGVLED